MADEGGAVAEAPVETGGAESSVVESTPENAGESTQSTADKIDGREQPDALKKRISELRRQADTITDPAAKAALLADAKALNDTVGKGRAYEKVFPTVREARETKTLVESIGGREGLLKQQETLARIQQIDHDLETGNPSAADALWKEAPDGMVKLAPMIFANLEKVNPAEYQKAVVPHAIKFLDSSGFPNAFDKMTKLYASGKTAEAEEIRAELATWVSSQRNQTAREPKVDPRVQELEGKLTETQQREQQQEVDRAYNGVVQHAGPVIDRYLKPIVGKLGLTKEQYADLREDTWKHLQDTRNADPTYKTVAGAKQKQGMDAVSEYIKSETENRAQDAARTMANRRYGHQLKNGAVKAPNVTAPVTTPGVTRGKEPTRDEIDYTPKGWALAKKAGYKGSMQGIQDMIMDGKAPLKVGGIRQWR
jgi:hypothetical protein